MLVVHNCFSFLCLGGPPALDSIVKPREKSLFRLMPVDAEDGETDPNFVQLISCMGNSVQSHMVATESLATDDELGDYDNGDLYLSDGTHLQGEEKVVTGASTASRDDSSESDSEESDDDNHVLVFEEKFKLAIRAILECDKNGICVAELPLTSDSEKMHLASVLWEDGVIGTLEKVDSPDFKNAKRTKR